MSWKEGRSCFSPLPLSLGSDQSSHHSALEQVDVYFICIGFFCFLRLEKKKPLINALKSFFSVDLYLALTEDSLLSCPRGGRWILALFIALMCILMICVSTHPSDSKPRGHWWISLIFCDPCARPGPW